MTYRIMTKDKHRKGIVDILKRRFQGFTLIPAIGYWKGQQEKSLIAEIELDFSEEGSIMQAAEEIKAFNHQDAVLVERLETRAQLV